MKDVALATSAAPFFFAKKKMKDFVSHPEDSEEHFWDGGVVLNNPAREAYKKACNELFLKDRKKIRFLIVSIGTGKSAQSNLDVLGKTLSNIMDSAATAVDRDLKEEFEHNKNLGLYKRINVPLDKSIELNDASIEALNTLEVATENYLGGSEGKKDIKEIVSWLKQKRPYTTKGDIIEPDTFQAQRSVNGNSSQKEDL